MLLIPGTCWPAGIDTLENSEPVRAPASKPKMHSVWGTTPLTRGMISSDHYRNVAHAHKCTGSHTHVYLPTHTNVHMNAQTCTETMANGVSKLRRNMKRGMEA